jgi:hypothetical protein
VHTATTATGSHAVPAPRLAATPPPHQSRSRDGSAAARLNAPVARER